jgi:hypothetical protein
MPKIFEERGYVFSFYEADLDEPVHVHVRKQGKEAKVWVNPIDVARAGEFSEHELNAIERIIRKRRNEIIAIWAREAARR